MEGKGLVSVGDITCQTYNVHAAFVVIVGLFKSFFFYCLPYLKCHGGPHAGFIGCIITVWRRSQVSIPLLARLSTHIVGVS